MNFYKSNLEYLLKNIQSQKELLTFQEKYLKLLENKMESADDNEEIGTDEANVSSTVVKIGDFAKMIKSRGVPYGRNKVHSWFNNRGYTYRENDRNYAKDEYIAKGLFEVKRYVRNSKDGTDVKETIYLTPQGVAYFMEKILREFNIEEM
ncbi:MULTISPECIES: phage antirepressor KilAC domain-containing protein [Terrisporobacter]|uniref:Antirepressor protein C-terminal domain-containing protein n=1 Tax=Terrisporobacter othiniensis TaxID=1577792 RepID=A0A0B3VYI8_9FIRM|nr:MULTISPECIES: phage antirepressor KilAC domain-containing protein [Terrisporobacter]KHS57794.1 hypothetical protein QX51_06435 [Terrisporobacter othiniensis]MCC3670611.1 phage antirepressor KilAC domain-containing protein [Terrisporobacter mayombei]MDU6983207.1 phage antirepressor KilAC domain-containing protein [Terrisporobacter othiniensis]